MFGSNFPVDKADGWSAERLLAGFGMLARGLSVQDKENLYGATARRVYRIP